MPSFLTFCKKEKSLKIVQILGREFISWTLFVSRIIAIAISISHKFRSVSSSLLYSEIIMFVCSDYFWYADISLLLRRFFSRNTVFLGLQFSSYSLFSSENNAFSATCDVCRKLVKLVFWSKYNEIFVLVLSIICTLLSEVVSTKSNTIRYSVTHDSSCVSSQCTRHGWRWRYKRTDWQSSISGATR